MASVAEVVRIPVAGMTCDHCVGTVRRALEGVPGVRSAVVDLKEGHAEVAHDPAQTDRASLEAAVTAAGYSVPHHDSAVATPPMGQLVTLSPVVASPAAIPPEPAAEDEWNLAIGGMHCASCVARVEGALAGVPGVSDARVNLATERASVVVDPHRVDVESLAAAVERAGYTARRAELEPGAGAEALRSERAEHVAYWRRRLVVGVGADDPARRPRLWPDARPLVVRPCRLDRLVDVRAGERPPGLPGRSLSPRGLGSAPARARRTWTR
jgi:Cu+-exporting ATPase